MSHSLKSLLSASILWAALAAPASLAGCVSSSDTPSCDRDSATQAMREGMISRTVRIDQADRSGSGVRLDDDYILTAYHVVNTPTSPIWINGDPEDRWIVGKHWIVEDIAVLVREGRSFGRYINYHRALKVGSRVYTAGFPRGYGPYMTEGFVSSIKDGRMALSANGYYGSSGSGVFDIDGNVVGVIQAMYLGRDNQALTFMMIACDPGTVDRFLGTP